jgi:hypothetical protein
MGEGRGEGRSAEQPKRAVEFTHCALTLNPSPVRRERELRDSAEVFFPLLGSNVKETNESVFFTRSRAPNVGVQSENYLRIALLFLLQLYLALPLFRHALLAHFGDVLEIKARRRIVWLNFQQALKR